MIELTETIDVDAPADAVFSVIRDVGRYDELFVGITRWEPVGEVRGEVGDRFDMRMHVGSIDAGGQMVVEQIAPPELIAWSSEQGVEQSGHFRLHQLGPERTRLEHELTLRLPGWPFGRLVERIAGRILARRMRATLETIRHQAEWE